MERMKNWFMKNWLSKWLLALLATMMVVGGLAGCSSQDVETALDVAIEVLEVAESLEAMEAEAPDGKEDEISQSDSEVIIEENEEDVTGEVPKDAAEDAADEMAEESAEAAEAVEAAVEESEKRESETAEPAIDEDGHYTSKEEVALYIHTYGKLPSNYISKNKAEELGWKKKDGEAGQLHIVAPGMSIGGSKFGNYEGLLPEAKGRKYYECDINYVKGNRGAERIVYSNDGLIFYTGDHYESFEQLYPVE